MSLGPQTWVLSHGIRLKRHHSRFIHLVHNSFSDHNETDHFRVSGWPSDWGGIWHCHFCGLGHFYGSDLIRSRALELLHIMGMAKKKTWFLDHCSKKEHRTGTYTDMEFLPRLVIYQLDLFCSLVGKFLNSEPQLPSQGCYREKTTYMEHLGRKHTGSLLLSPRVSNTLFSSD